MLRDGYGSSGESTKFLTFSPWILPADWLEKDMGNGDAISVKAFSLTSGNVFLASCFDEFTIICSRKRPRFNGKRKITGIIECARILIEEERCCIFVENAHIFDFQ
jgi:hypothetical protein